MLFLISIQIPDNWKILRWELWDRRQAWRSARGAYPSFQMAYEALRVMERTRQTLMEARAAA